MQNEFDCESCLDSRIRQTGINIEMPSATLELLSSSAQVRKGQVHEGLTALFSTSNYALAILNESNARIVRQDHVSSIGTKVTRQLRDIRKFYILLFNF